MVAPGNKVKLAKFDPDDTLGYSHDEKTQAKLATTLQRLDRLQYVLYATKKKALLIVLQAMDAGGKDGTIRHVMTGVNPQGCRVTSFKQPTQEELAHDFLWRIHAAVPARGMLGIFNRSHYEDVLVVRVHGLVPKKIWKARYDQINEFEKLLDENGVTILKFFLHISKDEQKKRFEERLTDPRKYWKFGPADLKERELWDQYQEAYEAALERCSTKRAPWFIIPANHKWFRNLAVSKIVLETLEGFEMQMPGPAFKSGQFKKKI
jgi:PPK2 family polyphosphate:nucleotide phosphotransferase